LNTNFRIVRDRNLETFPIVPPALPVFWIHFQLPECGPFRFISLGTWQFHATNRNQEPA
jgi:hypothetical protein